MEVYIPIITAILTGIIGPILVYWVKRKVSKTESNNTEQYYTESDFKLERKEKKINEQVQDQLDEIREKLGADRTWIMEFHNRKEGVDSASKLKKFSMVYESVAPGVSEEKNNFKDLLVPFFIQTISSLIENKELFYEDITVVESDEVLKIFEQKGNASMYMFAMETIDDILIGVLGVDYTRKKRKLTDEEKEFLRSQAYSLAGYLQNRNFE